MSDHAMKKFSTTNWDRVDALTDDTVDTTDIPPLPDSFFEQAILRQPRACDGSGRCRRAGLVQGAGE